MLTLSKRTDYALIALAYLAERPDRVASAREIAEAYGLPLSLLMNLLKALNQQGWLKSIRGTKGGYRIGVDPHRLSLHDLIEALEGPVRTTECVGRSEGETAADAGDGCEGTEPCQCRVQANCPIQAPLRALHHRLVRFLKEVKLSDLILAGHRIDVPLEMVGVG